MPIAHSPHITGHVQGVYFREWMLMVAGELSSAGWVRNRKNGHVGIHAGGEPDQMEGFNARLRKGSPVSPVDGVDIEPAKLENVAGFTRRVEYLRTCPLTLRRLSLSC